jgi:hypothetical protein
MKEDRAVSLELRCWRSAFRLATDGSTVIAWRRASQAMFA